MDYLSSLGPQESKRYVEKIAVIGEDPYKISKGEFSSSPDILPSITYPDIYNYLVVNPSPYSKEELKAYKSLDAYNQFVCGWVREIVSLVQSDNCLVKAKVWNFIKNITRRFRNHGNLS